MFRSMALVPVNDEDSSAGYVNPSSAARFNNINNSVVVRIVFIANILGGCIEIPQLCYLPYLDDLSAVTTAIAVDSTRVFN